MTTRAHIQRLRLDVRGFVQGVGFRPFVHRLAYSLGLTGLVRNHSRGVTIEVEGAPPVIARFVQQLQSTLPPLAELVDLSTREIPTTGSTIFSIVTSERDSGAAVLIPPDIATCDDCFRELFDPADRRYRYPFINCTNCGPRFTIVESIPYDRPYTSMKSFPMCADCRREYEEPSNRRFHAQPNACPVCGPNVWLHEHGAAVDTDDPIAAAVKRLKAGRILAIRGIGGFHLIVDAHNDAAVAELRTRKGRAEKPFALMSPDLDTVRSYCTVSAGEEQQLMHYSRPIVLLEPGPGQAPAPSVAPRQRRLGFMLAYSPLHHLVLHGNFDALVMTSGNYSEEPIAIDNDEALDRLATLADCFLLHDREIRQRCDDSVVRVDHPGPTILRRARGYVPRPVRLSEPTEHNVLAVGPEMKNTAALTRGNEVFLTQHVGDLDNPRALAFFEHTVNHLKKILDLEIQLVACDLHPEYLSTKWAMQQSLPVVQVQHHHAHLASVMADCGIDEGTIGIILDGTGYGTDGNIWGGEVLVGDFQSFERMAWLQPVAMPGGTMAIKQPWRMALSYLHAAYGSDLPDIDWPETANEQGRRNLLTMIDRQINSPLTSSCGRLFDAVSAILGVCTEINYDAQAAIELEAIADPDNLEPFDDIMPSTFPGPLDTRPLVRCLIEARTDTPVEFLAARFHASLAELFIRAAKQARDATGVNGVALGGGVYNNRLLLRYVMDRLAQERFTVYTHKQVPTNDGGLALGQAVIADRQQRAAAKE